MAEVAIRRVGTLDCRFEPGPFDRGAWPWAEANRARIEAHWAGLVAGRPGLFNGKVLLMHRWALEAGTLRSTHRLTDYAAFLAWRDFGFPDASVRNCFAMAALLSADGAYLLGEMGPHTANAGKVYFPAGTPDPSDIVDGRVDLEGSVRRELAEETGLEPHEVAPEAGWTLLEAGPRVALMRRVRSSLDADALAARIEGFLAREAQPELARMHVVRGPADLDALADRMPDFQQAYLREALAPTGQRTG